MNAGREGDRQLPGLLTSLSRHSKRPDVAGCSRTPDGPETAQNGGAVYAKPVARRPILRSWAVSTFARTIPQVITSLRKPILVNRHEQAVDAGLSAFCVRRSLRLFPKVRVADVLPISDGLLNRAEESYGLKAHFDFVVADVQNNAELVVEFDGPSHWSDPKTIVRDEMKDAICRRHALPILRIGAGAFAPLDDRRTFLEWILEVWSAYRNLSQAWAEVEAVEERGEDWDNDLPEIRLDDFDYRTFGGLHDWDEPGRMISAPLDPFRRARKRIGSTLVGVNVSHPEGWIGKTSRGTVGYVAVAVDGGWLLGTGHANLGGLSPWISHLWGDFVAQDIALLRVAEHVDGWERSERAPLRWDEIEQAVNGCKPMLIAPIEPPTKRERADFILRTIKGWGVNSADPLVQAHVWTSIESDPCGLVDGWDDL